MVWIGVVTFLSFGAVAGNDKLPPAINLVFKTGCVEYGNGCRFV